MLNDTIFTAGEGVHLLFRHTTPLPGAISDAIAELHARQVDDKTNAHLCCIIHASLGSLTVITLTCQATLVSRAP